MNALRLILSMCLLAILVSTIPTASPALAAEGEASAAPKFIISTNPILDLFTWFNGEFEIKMAPSATIGVAGSFISFDDGDETYAGFNGFFRYYPQAKAPGGFFFGGRLGFNTVSAKADLPDEEDESGTVFGAGIDIGYTWLLGEPPHFALSIGIGAIRYFGGDLEDVAMTLPTVRLVNIGYAF